MQGPTDPDFEVLRFSSGAESTLGLLFQCNPRKFLCFTLEDQAQTQKVYGETRIPAGFYRLGLRTVGKFHERYQKLFPRIHQGMIEVLKVPNFTAILWHRGNDDDDTAGCLLVGNQSVQNVTERGKIQASTDAYVRVYPLVRDAILRGPTYVRYVDFDGPIDLAG